MTLSQNEICFVWKDFLKITCRKKVVHFTTLKTLVENKNIKTLTFIKKSTSFISLHIAKFEVGA